MDWRVLKGARSARVAATAKGTISAAFFVASGLMVLGPSTAGCIANAPDGLERRTDGEGGAGGDLLGTTNVTTGTGNATTTGPDTSDPHGVFSADPPHGPFRGETRVLLAGKGFTPEVRVWFGEVEATDVVAIDPTTVQVVTPPHPPGAVDLTTQNGGDTSTRRTLVSGFTFDALYAEPDDGPVAGGTVVTFFGSGNAWDQESSVTARVDNVPCTTTQVVGPDQLTCTVPQGSPGTKSISVETASSGTVAALDAYTYADSDDGFKGGLGGDPLGGTLRVLAFNNFTGDPIPGAHVVVGSDVTTGLVGTTDATGVVELTDPRLDLQQGGGGVMVTVAAKCHSPITFAEVPVDTVTTYLDPVLTPQCAATLGNPPPPGGGTPILGGRIEGELVWPSTQEFQRGSWNNVPPAGPNEERIAYVFFAGRDANRPFVTPSASFQVRESDEGGLGYGFSVVSVPGNQFMYAVAGLRNLQTGAFTPYSFGATNGVTVVPGATTVSVVIRMDHPLDQALALAVTPPPTGTFGPDRLDARVVVEVAQGRFAILPGMRKTPFLPLPGNAGVSFVGLPPLHEDLTGMRYITSANAATGPSLTSPLSVVRSFATTTTGLPVAIDGFIAVPELVSPSPGGPWDGRNLEIQYPTGGFPADLSVYEVASGGGLWRWVVAVPGGAHSLQLPDLTGFEDAFLPPGPVVIRVSGARIEDFDYGTIGYRNLRPAGQAAYANDTFDAFL